MEQPVKSIRGQDFVISKDLSPAGEGFVAGENDRLALFVALADGLEKQTGVGLFKGQTADLIHDEKLGTSEVLDLAGEGVSFT